MQFLKAIVQAEESHTNTDLTKAVPGLPKHVYALTIERLAVAEYLRIESDGNGARAHLRHDEGTARRWPLASRVTRMQLLWVLSVCALLIVFAVCLTANERADDREATNQIKILQTQNDLLIKANLILSEQVREHGGEPITDTGG